ncbi:MAG: HAMP domain-containing sensor histidine kinase [Acidobacteriota bacterium]
MTKVRSRPPEGFPKRRARARRRALLLGFLAALVPLLILLGLQYRWLTELEESSRVAREASLGTYLDAIAKNVGYGTWKEAEWSLSVSATALKPEYEGKLAKHFTKVSNELSGSRTYFVVSFGDPAKISLYDFETKSMVKAAESPRIQAFYAAAVPWIVRGRMERRVEKPEPEGFRDDPEMRLMIRPLVDDESRLVGLAGMTLDPDHYRDNVLPSAFEEVLGKQPDLVATVWNQRGERMIGPEDEDSGNRERTIRRLPKPFDDWKVSIHSPTSTPEQWARANFLFNLTLSAVLALVLLGGIGLALRTASREMHLSEMKSDFVSNVSHELRTPLSSIRVFGEFMRLDRVTDAAKVREYGEYIETESRRLTQLIDNILDFSRIESGGKVYHRELCDLEELVAGALKTFEVRLRQKGFRVYLERPEADEPLLLNADPGALVQAVCNLIDNAVKYSNGGQEIQVTIERRGDPETGEAVVSVRDHGIGISREEQKHIFDRFHRVGTGLVHDVRGAGLGLSIVQHIVEAHGGRVDVKSDLGRGSTFSLHFPLEPTGETVDEEKP